LLPVLWSNKALQKSDSALAIIFNTPCVFYGYNDSSQKLTALDTLIIGDSLEVYSDRFSYAPIYYPAVYKGTKGYINGLGLGYKTEADFDGDGKTDRILYGYTYIDTLSDEVALYPITVNFLSANGQQYTLQDSGYSEMDMEVEDGAHFSSPTKCFILSTGYPACAYRQYHTLMAFSHNKPEVLNHSVSAMDGEYGDYYNFEMPVDTTHRTDTIYVVHRANVPLDDESDSVVLKQLDSTLIYPTGNTWAKQVFVTDTSQYSSNQ
jgi:hypothetical protein